MSGKKYGITVLMFSILWVGNLSAQKTARRAEVLIQTSAQCEMCKTRIESNLAYEKGVIRSYLDLESKKVTVSYKPKRTNPENIRRAIAAVGYDADEVPADKLAYSKLPGCCKKPDDQEYTPH
jgi:copper chaperone CopZ